MKKDGQYTLLKTFPMCRWSGQLGPKVREGDRQVPEGFYAITPGQMNRTRTIICRSTSATPTSSIARSATPAA